MTDDIRKLLTQTLDVEIKRVDKDIHWCELEAARDSDNISELERDYFVSQTARLKKRREDLLAAKREIAIDLATAEKLKKEWQEQLELMEIIKPGHRLSNGGTDKDNKKEKDK